MHSGLRMSTSQPLAIAKPPPSSRMMFQGTLSWAFFQERRGTYALLLADQENNIFSMHSHYMGNVLNS